MRRIRLLSLFVPHSLKSLYVAWNKYNCFVAVKHPPPVSDRHTSLHSRFYIFTFIFKKKKPLGLNCGCAATTPPSSFTVNSSHRPTVNLFTVYTYIPDRIKIIFSLKIAGKIYYWRIIFYAVWNCTLYFHLLTAKF